MGSKARYNLTHQTPTIIKGKKRKGKAGGGGWHKVLSPRTSRSPKFYGEFRPRTYVLISSEPDYSNDLIDSRPLRSLR